MAGNQGGARPGSGRPKSGKETRTQELIKKAIEGGKTPVDVLINNMRYYDTLACDAILQVENAQSAKNKARLFRVVKELTGLAKDYAVSAAPYIHPKLNAISAPSGGPIELALKVSFVAPKPRS